MKRIILMSILILTNSCNMSDRAFELPSNYIFVKEGGNRNIVIRHNKMIIDQGAVDFSFDDNFIVFSVDSSSSMKPDKIPKQELIYYVHNIRKDTLSKPLNYVFVIKFLQKNNFKNKKIL